MLARQSLRHAISILLISLFLIGMNSLGFAAVAPVAPTAPEVGTVRPGTVPTSPTSPTPPASSATLEQIRVSSDDNAFRLVFDMSAIPVYTVSVVDSPFQVEIEFYGTINHSSTSQLSFNDQFVDKMRLVDLGGGRLKAIVSLKLPVYPKVQVMSAPTRLVVDLQKSYDYKTENVIAPGIKYIEMVRGRSEGPIKAFILDVDLKSGYTIRPVLSNDVVAGLETVSDMAARTNAIAMINGPFFSRNGEIIGLLKMDGVIINTPDIARTALGVLPNNRIIMDMVFYEGIVELPSGVRLNLDGVDRGRGESNLILYNEYNAYWTMTQPGGMEYIIRNGQVVSTNEYNTVIPAGAQILSASGRSAWLVQDLKVGSRVKITQTLGPLWDTTVHAISAGPRLIKDNQLFLATLTEEFGSDVAGGRAPRTAVGVTKEGHILLVVVDGRRRTSVGFSLLELAQFMQELGSVDAMNFDGGGSSEMMIGDQIVNRPSDGRERPMAAAIAVVRQQRLAK